MPKAVEIKGAKELIRKLENLGSKTAVRLNRRAINLASTPIVKAAKAKCPTEHGDLKKSLTKKIYNKGMTSGGIIGADASYVVANAVGQGYENERLSDTSKKALDSLRGSGVDLTRPSKYDYLVEFGHKGVPPHAFIRPAWDSTVNTAEAIYEKELATGLEKEASKGK